MEDQLLQHFLFGFEAVVRSAEEKRLDPPREVQYVCLECGGHGFRNSDPCPDCDGTGLVDQPVYVGCSCKGDRCVC